MPNGLLAGTVGLLGLIYALFGQTGQYETSEASSNGSSVVTTTGTTSMWATESFHPVLVLFLLVILLSCIGVLAGAVLYGRQEADSALPLLWVSASALLLGSIVSMFSIGLYLLPGALLRILAALFASVGAGQNAMSERKR